MGGVTFTWLLKKKIIITLSTCKTEYITSSFSVKPHNLAQDTAIEAEVLQLKSTEI
jgi:hypothetical protein